MFVEDVVDAFVGAINLIEKIGKEIITIEIGSGKSVSLRDFARVIERLASRKSRINWGSLAYRKKI